MNKLRAENGRATDAHRANNGVVLPRARVLVWTRSGRVQVLAVLSAHEMHLLPAMDALAFKAVRLHDGLTLNASAFHGHLHFGVYHRGGFGTTAAFVAAWSALAWKEMETCKRNNKRTAAQAGTGRNV